MFRLSALQIPAFFYFFFTDPLDKKAEGVCSDTCDDDFAVCINGICKCSGNFVTLSDYTCGEYATLRFHI